MKDKSLLAIHILLNLLCGFAISSISNLLIYFKQKPLLHHFVALLAVSSIYFGFYRIRKRIRNINSISLAIALLVLISICWLAPQFIYQIRPYTFYISGFAIGSIVLIAISGQMLQANSSLLQWSFLILLLGYVSGIWIPVKFLQYLIVALLSIYFIIYLIISKPKYIISFPTVLGFIICSQIYFQFSKPITLYPEQKDFEDKVVFTSETQFHNLVITQWQKDHWLFIDKLKNICSIDEYLFYEPMVHSAFEVREEIRNVLVAGGENGCLLREVLKYDEVSSIDVVSYDSLLSKLGQENFIFTGMNENSFGHRKVNIIEINLLEFVSTIDRKYDAIYIDLPDPRSIESNQYYTLEFYRLLKNLLTDQGVLVTQAGSPYFATEAFYSIEKTLNHTGFNTLPIHNQILTLGEWGWFVCSVHLNENEIKHRINGLKKVPVETKWWNKEAAKLVTSFGKTYSDTLNVGINTLDNPVVYQYYLKGNWDME